jgi:hypothetical protein
VTRFVSVRLNPRPVELLTVVEIAELLRLNPQTEPPDRAERD